jgi:glyoxylase-like metal-dependent hydrolase (beta-lactamase superfamily II)
LQLCSLMRIHRIQGVMAASYLIETEGGLFLVDAGFLGTKPLVLRAIRALGRRPEELRYVFITHPHLDHFGGLAALRERYDFGIGAHPLAVPAIAAGGKEFSPGRTPFAKWVAWLARTSLPHLKFRGAGPVRGLENGQSLHSLGLPGRVVHTPGHTESCISLVLDDGTAFTGDLVQGVNPLTGRPAAPSMAWSLRAATQSWRALLQSGIERVLPAHGGAMPAGTLAEMLSRAEPLPVHA